VEAIELQLGRLDAAVERLQGAKARLKRYKQAVLKAAVEGRLTHPDLPEGELPDGWRVERLADIVADGPSNGYSPKPSKDQKGTKSLKLSATTTGRMILNEDTIKYIPEVVPKDSKYWLRPGDVLLQRANSLEYLGLAAMYTGGHHEYIYPDLMMRVRLDNPHLAQYLVQYLNTTTARQYFIKRATGTAGNMPKINGETVRELEVPVPTERDLPTLLAKLDEALTGADGMEATLDAQLQQAVRLRQAVLKRAFEGRLG
jgi:type I restriction enzyme S subunit